MKLRLQPIRGRWLLLAVTIVAGCSFGNGPQLAPVRGTVRFKGQPMKDIAVVFHTENGMLASGITDADGKFQLSTVNPRDGAPLGEHRVTLVYKDPTENVNPPPSPIPVRYRQAETSGLTVVVERKPNAFTFELTEN